MQPLAIQTNFKTTVGYDCQNKEMHIFNKRCTFSITYNGLLNKNNGTLWSHDTDSKLRLTRQITTLYSEQLDNSKADMDKKKN